MTESSITIEIVKGHETSRYLPLLIELRLSFFRSYPYFYEGNVTNEKNYVGIYANSENSLLTVAKKGSEVIGVITGIPLLESQTENKKLFGHSEIPAEKTFFIGELVIADSHRNSNVEHQLYQQFENTIKDLKKYDTLLVCEIERNDSKKSLDPYSAEIHWEDRGFAKRPELNAHYSWQELGDSEKTNHLMICWKKTLSE